MTTFPKDLQMYPEEYAREIYIYRIVGRGLARTFYKEFEEREKAKEEGEVEFRFVDVVMFFAKAAASGVLGRMTYDAIQKVIKSIRKPRLEFGSGGIRFEAVVSRRFDNRIRREKNSGKRADRSSSAKVAKQLETEYRLMVSLKKTKKGR
jgi:hypothetical protein